MRLGQDYTRDRIGINAAGIVKSIEKYCGIK